jgi:hypothetical protein
VLVLILANRTNRFFITFACASAISEIANVLLPTLGPMSVLGGNASFVNVPTLAERGRTLSSHCVRAASRPSISTRSTELSASRP